MGMQFFYTCTCTLAYVHVCDIIRKHVLYKTIYWRGVYFGKWQFIRLFVDIKSANINVTTI